MHHQRLSPRQYGFSNSIFLFYLNLDELQSLNHRLTLFSNKFPGFYKFNDADYLPTGGMKSLKERAINAFRTYGLNESIETICMLTHVRTLGYVFNPITFYSLFLLN